MENLILKVPEFLNENAEINAFFDAVEPELELIKQRIETMYDNIWVSSADNNGVRHYEDWLKIPYDRTLTLEDRKIEVLARLNETLPFTEIRLQRFLAACVGWGHFKYKRDGAYIQVELDIDGAEGFRAVWSLLHRIVPLNCHFDLVVKHVHQQDFLKFGIGTYITEIIKTKPYRLDMTARVSMDNSSVVEENIITKPTRAEKEIRAKLNNSVVVVETITTK